MRATCDAGVSHQAEVLFGSIGSFTATCGNLRLMQAVALLRRLPVTRVRRLTRQLRFPETGWEANTAQKCAVGGRYVQQPAGFGTVRAT